MPAHDLPAAPPATAPLPPAAPAFPPVEPATPATPSVADPAPTATYPAAGPIPPGYAPVGTSAYPVSAPAYPVSAPGYPVSAMPLGYGYEPPKPKRTGVIVLSIATGVLALIAVGMATLFLVEHSNRTNADKKVSEQTTALTAEQAKTKDLEGQLSTSRSDLAKVTQELEGAKGKTADVQKERDAMAACFRALDDYYLSKTAANAKKADDLCREASKYY
jgi:hypothetical protein